MKCIVQRITIIFIRKFSIFCSTSNKYKNTIGLYISNSMWYWQKNTKLFWCFPSKCFASILRCPTPAGLQFQIWEEGLYARLGNLRKAKKLGFIVFILFMNPTRTLTLRGYPVLKLTWPKLIFKLTNDYPAPLYFNLFQN